VSCAWNGSFLSCAGIASSSLRRCRGNTHVCATPRVGTTPRLLAQPL
jgi:hypothetical protein